jgi:hypothetical protein
LAFDEKRTSIFYRKMPAVLLEEDAGKGLQMSIINTINTPEMT